MKSLVVTFVWYVARLVPFELPVVVLVGLLALIHAVGWPWYAWVFAAPLLYGSWLLLLLAWMSITTRLIGRRYPKPRRAIAPAKGRKAKVHDPGLITVALCYHRAGIIQGLPFARWLPSFSGAPLCCYAYSPSVHFGRSVTNLGDVCDPDLTLIGDDVVIGAEAFITAHSITARPDGDATYVSAPVEIGDRVTIGGRARIDLGCSIGADALIEPCAWLAPYTRVAAGEVWGGNPAVFRARRDSVGGANGAVWPAGAQAPSSPDAEVHAWLLEVLMVGVGDAPQSLGEDTCPAWDSLGRLAIAAALFDRYGIEVEHAQLADLSSEEDVLRLIASRRPARSPNASPAPLPDLELLPLDDVASATRKLSEAVAALPAGEPFRVVIAASFTADPIAATLKLWGRAFGFELHCEFASYDQLEQVLLDPRSPFGENRAGVNVLLTRVEDLFSPEGRSRIDVLLDAIRTFAASGRGGLLVGSLPPVVSAFACLDCDELEEARGTWRAQLRNMAGVDIFDFAGVVERLGVDAARSNEGEVLNRAPYCQRLYQALAVSLVRQIRAARRAPAKIIVLDCDNTLWGGVLGEVGLAGVALGPDGEGRAFQLLQRFLQQLKERGVLLAVASKNEEADVFEMFESHPDMVLRPADIVAWKIGWGSKSSAIAELSEELNLGLDSFVFVDDNPVERLELQMALPAVHVVPLPEMPSEYVETLARLWLFDGAQVTAEDEVRTELVHEEGERQRARRAAQTLEEFLFQLELRVEVRPPQGAEWARVAQLTQKTNQFNLSLRRQSLAEVQAADGPVLVLRAQDRFGDYGLVGVAMLKTRDSVCEIDTLLMSCRALGRGVEEAFVHVLAHQAARSGARALIARSVAGPRNAQVVPFLKSLGFRETEPDCWAMSLEAVPQPPRHVQINLPYAVA